LEIGKKKTSLKAEGRREKKALGTRHACTRKEGRRKKFRRKVAISFSRISYQIGV